MRNGRFDKHVAEMPYQSIESVAYKAGLWGVTINLIGCDTHGYKIDGPQEEDAEPFVDYVQNLLTELSPAPLSIPRPEETKRDPAIERSHSIDARRIEQWQEWSPKWLRDKYRGEHEMLYEMLEADETIECIFAAYWGNKDQFYKVDDRGKPVSNPYDGIVVATNRRVFFLDQGFISSAAVDLPYHRFKRISVDNGNRVRIIGESTDEFGYVFHTGDEPRGAGLGEAAGLFVTAVRNHLPAKWNRIDAQLQALPVEGYRSQCALLYDILHDDEDIEGLITGEYKGDVKGASSYDGIVVATSRRRVFFLGSGPSGKNVAEMPHENIEAIEHAKRWLAESVTITGRDAHGYSVGNVPANAGEFAECVRNLLTAPLSRRPAKASMVEAKLQALDPRSIAWLSRYARTRRQLYDALEDDEGIEYMTYCAQISDLRKIKQGEIVRRGGTFVVTSRRILIQCADSKGEASAEMPYESIKAVSNFEPGPFRLRMFAGVQIIGHADDGFRMDKLYKDEAKELTVRLRSHLNETP